MRRKAAGWVIAALACLLPSCGKEGPKSASMLAEKDKKYVASTLAGMKSDVRLALFSRDGGECWYCDEAEGLPADIAAAAPRVAVEVLSLKKDAARAQELGIDKVPGIAILGRKDYNLRYFGLPSGYDFIPFVETVLAVANDDPGIWAATSPAVTTHATTRRRTSTLARRNADRALPGAHADHQPFALHLRCDEPGDGGLRALFLQRARYPPG